MKRSLIGIAFMAAASVFGLAPGDVAPDFALKNQSGTVVKLSALRGRPVLIYFYPKDDTPGCTKEACHLRDAYTKYQKEGAVVLGVSRQDQKSHQAFIKKYRLPFDLLVDSDGTVAASFGVGKIGEEYLERKSVLVGPDGKVVKFYNSVNPETHADEVLADIRSTRGAK